jgi:phage terminase large subunit-like protein
MIRHVPKPLPLEARAGKTALDLYSPYPKQRAFHNSGLDHGDRLLCAANQVGKTTAGGMEWAMHLTARYPHWWHGKTFNTPVRLWAAGVTAESTRDNPQRILLGPPQQKERWGVGAIPHDAIKEIRPARSVANAIDSIVVKWGGGGDVQMGESVLAFKSYEKGREKWQGETLNGVWFDEEPPLDIYSEGLTRTNATGGITIVTFTPLLGMSDVVLLFLSAEEVEGMGKG